jgi:hypothetical protein
LLIGIIKDISDEEKKPSDPVSPRDPSTALCRLGPVVPTPGPARGIGGRPRQHWQPHWFCCFQQLPLRWKQFFLPWNQTRAVWGQVISSHNVPAMLLNIQAALELNLSLTALCWQRVQLFRNAGIHGLQGRTAHQPG